MEKAELIKSVMEKSEATEEETEKIIDALVDSIKEGLLGGDKVVISGFGTFSLSKRKAQTFLNPKTRQTHEIPERVLPHFKAGKDFYSKQL